MSAYTDMDTVLYGAHSFQLLLILLPNKAQYSKLAFTRKIQKLTTCTPSSQAELVSLVRDFNGLHTLKNITENEEPFKCNEPLLLQVLDGIQRGLHTHNISLQVQNDYHLALQHICHIMARFRKDLCVRPCYYLLLMPLMLTKQLSLPIQPQPLPPLFSPSHLGRLPLSRALYPAKTVKIATTRCDRSLLSTMLPTRTAIVTLLSLVRPAASAMTSRAA